MSDIYRASRSTFQQILARLRRTHRPHRANSRGLRRGSVANPRVGRNVRPVPYQAGHNLLAPRLTVLQALQAGRYERATRRLTLRGRDLVGWDKRERNSLTLVLLVDTSRSSHYYIRVFQQILSSLTGHFHRQRDRMGLIVLQGRQASVLNHPTHNFRVVSNSLAKLTIRGESPLADGLNKALSMARIERYRNPGSRSLVVLLSDCYPEPLTQLYPDIFAEPAYRMALQAAQVYRKEEVGLLVINPAASEQLPHRFSPGPGERLSEMLAKAAGGRLIKIRPTGEGSTISQNEMNVLLDGVEAAFQVGRRPGSGQHLPTASIVATHP